MKRCITKNAHWSLLMSALVFLPCSVSLAQQDLDTMDEEDVYELSPFEVSTEGNDGYSATETLGGTRIRTDYRDLATPLTAVTAQFLQDTASKNNQDLLTYTTNTEVGGLYGNWGGFGNSQGIGDRSALLRPNNNTRVRGLDAADNTRNFFLSDISWDSYNVDRVEIQRGPNSILFGVGSPAGIINTSTIVAQMDGNSGKIENEYSAFNSNRLVADYNVELIDDVLAFRVAALHNDQKFRQKPAFNDDERLFATGTFQKQLLPESWADKTVVRLSVETAEVESNNPRILPPYDGITLWFEDYAGDGKNDLIGFDKRVMDMFLYSQAGGGDPYRGATSSAVVTDPFYQPGTTSIDGSALNNGGIGFWFINGESRPYFVSRQAPRSYPGGLAADGSVDNAVNSSPYGTPMRVSGMNNYSIQLDKVAEVSGTHSLFPLASRGYYKDLTLSDPTIFDFYNNLIDGDNKREYKDWDYANLSVAQTFFKNRVGVEFVYDRQDYKEWRGGATWNNPYISIDINKNLQHQVSHYDRVVDPTGVNADGLINQSSYSVPGFTPTAAQPYANAMAGAAFLAGGFANNEKRTVERETTRFTAYGELRASDFMDGESWLAKLIGRHIVTGLKTREEKYETSTEWRPAATTYQWALDLSVSGENTKLGESPRDVTPIIYLSDPLFDKTSASGLNLGPIRTYYNPSGTYNVTYFKTEWLYDKDPGSPYYLDPSAPWHGHFSEGTINAASSLYQADNPANYTGWTQAGTDILNAETGDLDQLITQYGVTQQIVDSNGFVWQGYLLDGLIVPTFGWREDKLATYTATGAEDATGIVATSAVPTEKILDNSGETISWGVVAHMPQKWVEKTKIFSGLSAFYNKGKNHKVEARYNYDGNPLDNPEAESEDYGVVINLLDDKLTVKLGHFETKVKNANLPGGSSILGSNQYYLYQLEAWGTANSLMYLFGREGLDPNQNWHWNWALVDSGWDSAWDNAQTKSWLSHPSMIHQAEAIDDWITQIDASFFSNYEIPADVAAIQSAYQSYKSSGDISPLIAAAAKSGFAVGTYTTGFSSQNNGQINGISPNGTIDNTSKGWEVEVNYRPIPNWNIQFNASKTDAYRESLGKPMLDFIAKQWEKLQGPAGDIRLWWGADNTIRRYYQDNIISAVQFQEESVGFQVPELSPWHASLVTNYSFTGDKYKGFNIGGALRYQDEQILGYGLKDDESGLDVNKPIYGDVETRLDMWFGYERKLTDKVNWRIQVNLRNVGEDVSLTPISANPDGTIAAQRITEGMTWAVTNTFRF